MKHYYQTTPLPNGLLEKSNADGIKQEERIIDFMREQKGSWTAWEILGFFNQIPITSIRRALFNLKEQGLIFEDGLSLGPYGKPVTRFKANSGQLSLF